MIHYITLKKPSDITSMSVKNKIKKLIEQNVKTYHIKLKLEFITNDDLMNSINGTFQRIKNREAFKLKGDNFG